MRLRFYATKKDLDVNANLAIKIIFLRKLQLSIHIPMAIRLLAKLRSTIPKQFKLCLYGKKYNEIFISKNLLVEDS